MIQIKQVDGGADSFDGTIFLDPLEAAILGIAQIEVMQTDGCVAGQQVIATDDTIRWKPGTLQGRGSKIGDRKMIGVEFLEAQA